MGNPSTRGRHRVPPKRLFRRSDRALRRTAGLAAAALALLAVANVAHSFARTAAQPAELPAVLVGCSDGPTCAVPASSGQVRTVEVIWLHPCTEQQASTAQRCIAQPPLDDPGAGL